MDPAHLRMLLVTYSAFLTVLLRIWEAISEHHESMDSLSASTYDEWFLTYLLLQWGAASSIRVPRFQTQSANSSLQWYIKPRSSIHWWNHFVFYAREDDERWREIFRLPYELFQEVADIVREDMQQKDIPAQLGTFPGRIFSVEKKVGIAIMLLASGNSQYHIANTFGCGRSTVSKFLHQFVGSIRNRASHVLSWPATQARLQEVKDGFQSFQGLPNCCGAIDATHLNMTLPLNERNESWFDRNGNYSMLMQGIVDHRMRFMDVNIGWPGSCNDKRILRNSGFYRMCQAGERLSGAPFTFLDLSIPEYIVGDGGYVLQRWLMIPFQRALLTSTQHKKYNFMQSSTRMVAERAFGRLKETWKFLAGTIRGPNIATLPTVVLACCILHNLLMDINDEPAMEPAVFDINDPLVDNPFLQERRSELQDVLEGEIIRSNLVEYIDMQCV